MTKLEFNFVYVYILKEEGQGVRKDMFCIVMKMFTMINCSLKLENVRKKKKQTQNIIFISKFVGLIVLVIL